MAFKKRVYYEIQWVSEHEIRVLMQKRPKIHAHPHYYCLTADKKILTYPEHDPTKFRMFVTEDKL
jgi:hypothetical protein